MTQEGGFNTNPTQTYVDMKSEVDSISTDKKPSVELVSLLSAATTGMLAFGELWDTVKTKGAEEGFDEKALLTLFAPMVKDKFTAAQVRYLMNKEKEQERAKQNRQKQKEEIKTLRTYAHIPPKKEPEQSNYIEETTTVEQNPEGAKPSFVPPPEVIEIPQEEDPKDLEIQYLKGKVGELEDALRKTQQFKPATALERLPEVIKSAEDKDKEVHSWLRNSADGIGTFYYDAMGIDLFKNRELSQLKNSGVKVFKRLYFEV